MPASKAAPFAFTAGVRGLAFELFRRHILQSSGDAPLRGDGGPRDVVGAECRGLFGEAEIQQVDALLRDQNVGGLQIAVDDAFAVGGVESVENLPGVLPGFLHRKRAV
jgi:hypothetical protein